jgi:hypothetical protein
MKLQAVLLSTLLLVPSSAVAQQRVYPEAHCYENREEYVPGYYTANGNYVRGYVVSNRNEVPCSTISREYIPSPSYNQPIYQKCNVARSTLGGLIGGGIAAAVSKVDAYGWSVPLGAVLGMGAAQAGCL